MPYRIAFNSDKNRLLKATRGVNFDDVLVAVRSNGILGDLQHPQSRYQHQRILIVVIDHYVYAVPYVLDTKQQRIFLKTVYPSRQYTKLYLKE